MKVKVSQQDWDKLAQGDRAFIGRVVGGYFKGAEIAPGPAAPSVGATAPDVGSFCEAACDLAQSAAEAACQGVQDPLGRQVCLVAAKAAGDLCRAQC